jgi:F0F1-type ATP synthase membrane subunit c/vacuolar-type H+-ATPase subunit K
LGGRFFAGAFFGAAFPAAAPLFALTVLFLVSFSMFPFLAMIAGTARPPS